jgi:hypothetical protein
MAHSDVILAFVRSPIPQTPVTGGLQISMSSRPLARVRLLRW